LRFYSLDPPLRKQEGRGGSVFLAAQPVTAYFLARARAQLISRARTKQLISRAPPTQLISHSSWVMLEARVGDGGVRPCMDDSDGMGDLAWMIVTG